MNIMNKRKQKAFITLNLFLTVFVLGILGIALVRLAPVYMEYYHVTESVNSLTTSKGFTTHRELKDSLLKRFYINDVTSVKRRHIAVTRKRKGFAVVVKYDATVPLFSSVDMVFHFNKQTTVPYHDL